MSSNGSAVVSRRQKQAGRRNGAGRKSKWPNGTPIKTMHLPAVLEEELRQYARQRMAEIKQTPVRANTRQADGPPPAFKQVYMQKITARHFTIEHKFQIIGDVCRVAHDRWLACLNDAYTDHPAFAEGPTRQDAVATLLIQERSRWLNEHSTAAGEGPVTEPQKKAN